MLELEFTLVSWFNKLSSFRRCSSHAFDMLLVRLGTDDPQLPPAHGISNLEGRTRALPTLPIYTGDGCASQHPPTEPVAEPTPAKAKKAAAVAGG